MYLMVLKTGIEEGLLALMAMNARVHCLREEEGDDRLTGGSHGTERERGKRKEVAG